MKIFLKIYMFSFIISSIFSSNMVRQHALKLNSRYQWHYLFFPGDKHSWLYGYDCKIYDNQNWQNDRPACNDYTLQVMMVSLFLPYFINIDFLLSFPSPLNTKLHWIVDRKNVQENKNCVKKYSTGIQK